MLQLTELSSAASVKQLIVLSKGSMVGPYIFDGIYLSNFIHKNQPVGAEFIAALS